MSNGSQSGRDMRYGRQGGRVVPWDGGGKSVRRHEAAPRLCEVCGHEMLVGQRGRHFVCDETSAVGVRCTCVPGCSTDFYGDGPRSCTDTGEPDGRP